MNQPQQPKRAPAPIEVVRFERATKEGSWKAFASVRLGGLVVHDFKVVHPDGKEPFVAPPSRKGTDGRWYDVVEVKSEDLKARIQEAIFAKWREGDPESPAPDGDENPLGEWD